MVNISARPLVPHSSSSRHSALPTRAPRRHLLGLHSRGQESLLRPQIDQGLHRLDLLIANQPKQPSNVDEMDKARVQLLVRAHVPERLQPVPVVDVRVAPHHLPVDALDVTLEGLREAGGLAEPFAAGELRQRSVERRRGEGLRCAVSWSCGAGGVGAGVDVRGSGVCGEDGRVVDFADDPFLHQVDVLDGGDFDGFLVVVKPGVCVAV